MTTTSNEKTFYTNSEANASELLENHEDMFPQYYIHCDVLSWFFSSAAQLCDTRSERVKTANHI